MDDDDTKPCGILSFVLADGTPWAEMRCLGWDVVDAQEDDDLLPEFVAHFISGNVH